MTDDQISALIRDHMGFRLHAEPREHAAAESLVRAVLAAAAPVRAEPVAAPNGKPAAYAVIVDGAWHGAWKHEMDARYAGFDTEKRFDLVPLYFVAMKS